MSTVTWPDRLHNLLVAVGFAALLAIVTGQNVVASQHDDSFQPDPVPYPLWVQQCDQKNWLSELLNLPPSKNNTCDRLDKITTQNNVFNR